MTGLAAFEAVIDASGVAPRIEAMLPVGVRPRQLKVATLLAGMCLAQAGHQPAHLTMVHQALISLPGDDLRRLGVLADWERGPHLLTYRQTERTFGLVAGALGTGGPDGLPAAAGASATACWRRPSRRSSRTPAGRWRWTGRTWSPSPGPRLPGRTGVRRPRGVLGPPQEQPAAQRGRAVLRVLPVRRDNDAGRGRPAVPELARRAAVSSCRHDPVPAIAAILTAMPAAGIPLGDVLADSGYSHRVPPPGRSRCAPPARSSSKPPPP